MNDRISAAASNRERRAEVTLDVRGCGIEPGLVTRALSGDPSAFDELFVPHENELRAFLVRGLGGRHDVSVEEAIQDTRIYVLRRLDRYNPEYPFWTFVRALAHNILKRHLHRRSPALLGRFAGAGYNEETAGTYEPTPFELEQLPASMRDVLGVDRFAPPDAWPLPSRLFLELLEMLLRDGGYPHQLVAFGFSILIWGKPQDRRRAGRRRAQGASASSPPVEPGRKVPVTGDPDRVVKEVGPVALGPACDDLMRQIETSLHLDPGFLQRVRVPLDRRLGVTCGELFARDPASLAHHRRIAGFVVGRTRLEDYFGRDARKSVSDWTHAVKSRLRRAFGDPAGCQRDARTDGHENSR